MPRTLEPFVDRLPFPPALDPLEVGPDGTLYYRLAISAGRANLEKSAARTAVCGPVDNSGGLPGAAFHRRVAAGPKRIRSF
jgi:hypothetical protein